MAEYINKDTARRIIDSSRNCEQMLAILESAPSEDVQPVRHGHWIKTRMPITGAIEIKCSECDQKYYTAFPLAWGYCPECGARMDGD